MKKKSFWVSALLLFTVLNASALFSDDQNLRHAAIGKIVRVKGANALAELGTKVVIRFKKKPFLVPGDRLTVFKVTEDLLSDPVDEIKDAETELLLGEIEITKILFLNRAEGKVVSSLREIEEGDLVKRTPK